MADSSGPVIDILLAVYNGASRLERQLASISAQTYPNWRLIVRDDGSTDQSLDILQAFAKAHPTKVTILHDECGNLRTLGNFARLLSKSTAPYCGFCDQDDIWDVDKLEIALREMQAMEANVSEGTPLLVVTDRRIIDEAGNTLADSFWEHQGIHPDNTKGFFSFLVYPVAAGSSMLLNAALRERAQPVSPQAIQYDCWIELVAAQFGVSSYMKGARLTYQRHSRNVSGGGRAYPANKYFRRALYLFKNFKRQRNVYRRFVAQANAFLIQYRSYMPDTERRKLEMFVGMEGAIWPMKVVRGLWSGGLPPTLERKIAFLLVL